MDVRRVQITGGSSFMITLPKSWAEKVGLKKNDPIEITSQPDGSLVLSIGGDTAASTEYSCTLDVDEAADGEALYRRLIGAYIAGHSPIIVTSKSSIRGEMLESVSRFTQTSIGMEIVEEDEARIVIKDLMDQTEIVPQKNVRREYLLVKRMIGDVFQTAADGDMQRLSGMEDRDTEVDRIHWLVQRQSSIHQMDVTLCSRAGMDLRDVTSCVPVSKCIERMGDHAVLMASHLSRLKTDDEREAVRRAMAGVSGDVISLFEDTMRSWSSNDANLAETCVRRAKKLGGDIEPSFGTAGAESDVGLIAGSARRLVEYCADISESAINSASERPGGSPPPAPAGGMAGPHRGTQADRDTSCPFRSVRELRFSHRPKAPKWHVSGSYDGPGRVNEGARRIQVLYITCKSSGIRLQASEVTNDN